MKKITIYLGISLILLILSLTACGDTSTPPTPTVDQNAAGTIAAQTIEAMLTEQAVNSEPSVEATITPGSDPTAAATPTSEPTALPSETPTTQPSLTPTAAASSTPCVDKAEFVEDTTIPDDTILLPGETFVKTWQLKNTGNCTWSTSYSLVFSQGDQLGGASPTVLTTEVKPEQTVKLSVELKAPGTTGTYRGDWRLSNATGQVFGIGRQGDESFWVQIRVQEGADDLNLGNPTWRDLFDNSNSWYMLSTNNTEWEIDNGQLKMKAKNTDAAEEWGLSNRAEIKNFFLEAKFKTGEACDGLDSYGVLVRAPDPNKGYVFEFSCDGRYRLYKWDGENYVAIQEWKASSAITAGSDKPNKLGIWLKDKTIRLYANGQLLGEFEDDLFDEGRFGLVIGADKTDDFIVYVDELSYWSFSD